MYNYVSIDVAGNLAYGEIHIDGDGIEIVDNV